MSGNMSQPGWDIIYSAPTKAWQREVYSWPLLSSPVPVILIALCYIAFVKFLGPWLMRDKKPLDLKPLIVIHNVFTVFLNSYLVYKYCRLGWLNDYSIFCQEFEEDTERGMQMNRISYFVFLSKIYDLIDTIFLVFIKKNSHITRLHVIHHSSMICFCYLGVRLAPNGMGTFGSCLNCFVHVIMYTYYTLALMGPAVRPYLWWKKYLTQMQLFQFFLIFLHSSQIYFQYPRPCNYPILGFYTYAVISVLFTTLFINFYIQTYLRSDSKSRGAHQSQPDRHKTVDLNNNGVVDKICKKIK